jgi:hypothetical protein
MLMLATLTSQQAFTIGAIVAVTVWLAIVIMPLRTVVSLAIRSSHCSSQGSSSAPSAGRSCSSPLRSEPDRG